MLGGPRRGSGKLYTELKDFLFESTDLALIKLVSKQ